MRNDMLWLDLIAIPYSGRSAEVPPVAQTTDVSCGAAALRACLKYYKINVSEKTLIKKLGTKKYGTQPKNISKVAREYGLRAKLVRRMSFRTLHGLTNLGIPVICAIQAWGSGHYVVVTGVMDTHVFFQDPYLRKYRGSLTKKEFMKRWHMEEKYFYHLGIPIDGDGPCCKQSKKHAKKIC